MIVSIENGEMAKIISRDFTMLLMMQWMFRHKTTGTYNGAIIDNRGVKTAQLLLILYYHYCRNMISTIVAVMIL